jgi:tellurite resistance protein TerC
MFAVEADRSQFVDLHVPAWAWVALLVTIAGMLAIDLYRHRHAHAPSTREALTESIVWVSCGLAFSVVIAVAFGADAFGEYISGYLIEKSLSVDNVFVWSMLFATLAIPVKYQHRVLFWGIFGALFLRAIAIEATDLGVDVPRGGVHSVVSAVAFLRSVYQS